MAESKHTAGPWEVSALDGRTIQHQNGFWKAVDGGTIPRWEGVATVLQRDDEETKANARLIAAAPELLLACLGAQSDIAIAIADLREGRTGAVKVLRDAEERLSQTRRKAVGSPPVEMTVNTRDEHGVKQPLDPKTAEALGQAGKLIHEKYSRMMSATPDLLDACREAIHGLSLSEDCQDEIDAIRAKIIAAIAKAEGRQS